MPQIGKPSKAPIPTATSTQPQGNGQKGKGKGKAAKEPTKPVPRPCLYPELKIAKRYLGSKDGPLTFEEAKKILGWETESEYKARKLAENPSLEGAFMDTIGFGDEYLLLDFNEEKVRCWNNSEYSPEGKLLKTNRPFDESWCKKLSQSVLGMQWAGPTCMGTGTISMVYGGEQPYKAADGTVFKKGDKITVPEFTPNGESVIIGQTGMIESAQHRLIGYILAVQRWRSEKEHDYWVAAGWETEPVLDTLVVIGVSESPRVLTTLDYTRPRSQMDTIYTSEIFQGLSSKERKKCSLMLARAGDFLGRRTHEWTEEAGGPEDTHNKTNPATEEFRSRHPKLLDCVRYMVQVNSENVLLAAGLSPGECAGMLYLQGSSTSDVSKYIDRDSSSFRSEKALSWDHWEKGKEFWSEVAKGEKDYPKDGPKDDQGNPIGTDRPFAPLFRALGWLVEVQQDARSVEKMGVVCKAWNAWLRDGADGLSFDCEPGKEPSGSLALEYLTTESGARVLSDDEDLVVGGIDQGDIGKRKKSDPVLTPDQVEANKQEERRRAALELQSRAEAVRGGKPNADNLLSLEDELTLHRRDHPNSLLFFTGPNASAVYGADVPIVTKTIGVKADKTPSGTPRCMIPGKLLQNALSALRKNGHRIALIERENGKAKSQVLEPIPKAEAPISPTGPKLPATPTLQKTPTNKRK